MGMEVLLQEKNPRKIAGAHKIGPAISGPKIAGEKFYRREALSERSRHFMVLATLGLQGG